MPDIADDAQEIEAVHTGAAVAAIRRNAELEHGCPGDCNCCGEWSGRLVRGACAPCRDKYKLL